MMVLDLLGPLKSEAETIGSQRFQLGSVWVEGGEVKINSAVEKIRLSMEQHIQTLITTGRVVEKSRELQDSLRGGVFEFTTLKPLCVGDEGFLEAIKDDFVYWSQADVAGYCVDPLASKIRNVEPERRTQDSPRPGNPRNSLATFLGRLWRS